MSKRYLSFFSLALIAITLGLVFAPVDNAEAQTGTWTATFYDTPNFTGNTFARSYSNAEMSVLSWGSGSPGGSIPADNFSAVFTTTQTLQTGVYQFRVYADDQAELRINNQLLIDVNSPGTQTANYTVSFASSYTIQVRYVELSSQAALQVQFFNTTNPNVGTGFTPTPTAPPTRTPLPHIPPGALTATVIRASVLLTRDAPSLGGNIIGRILRGETYAVLGRDERARWFLLQLGGYQGWSFGYYLYIDGNEFNPPVISAASLVALAGQEDYGVRGQTFSTMVLRRAPNVASEQIGRVTWGAFVPIIGRTRYNEWYQIVWKGTVGWIYSPWTRILEGDINVVPIKAG